MDTPYRAPFATSRRAVGMLLAAAMGTALTAWPARARQANQPQLVEVTSADRSWVQVVVSRSGRVFVNFSRWFGPLEMAVAEVMPDGSLKAYPDAAFNRASGPAAERAVSVQSVALDPDGNSLWIVDTGNPQLSGAVPGGAKLVQVDLATDRIIRVLPLGGDVAPPGSYLADIRIDSRRAQAYLPDLALGALAVVDLRTGRGRRVLEGHVSTQAEDLLLSFDGKPWLYPDGSRPRTAATSIALSPDGSQLYFKPLVGRTLYQVPLAALDGSAGDAENAVKVAVVAHPTDAMACGPDGALYLTAIDQMAITRWMPGDSAVRLIVQDRRLAWPVGLAFGPGGVAFTTVGRIHEGSAPSDRYRLYMFKP